MWALGDGYKKLFGSSEGFMGKLAPFLVKVDMYIGERFRMKKVERSSFK